MHATRRHLPPHRTPSHCHTTNTFSVQLRAWDCSSKPPWTRDAVDTLGRRRAPRASAFALDNGVRVAFIADRNHHGHLGVPPPYTVRRQRHTFDMPLPVHLFHGGNFGFAKDLMIIRLGCSAAPAATPHTPSSTAPPQCEESAPGAGETMPTNCAAGHLLPH